ncbi:MAG: LolA-related protein [Gammaproteobacteria bacterium]
MKTLLTLLGVLLCALASGQESDVGARLETLRLQSVEQIPFLEERHSVILAEPALYRGYLRYDPATRLMQKVVESPQAVTMAVDESNIYLERDGERRTIGLRSRPELGALLAGFRGLLEGDSEQLEKYFTLDYLEDAESWTLRLTPRNRRLKRHVDELVVDGRDATVSGIRTQMKNGDWQQLILTPDRAP